MTANALFLQATYVDGQDKWETFDAARRKFITLVPNGQPWRFIFTRSDQDDLLALCYVDVLDYLPCGRAAFAEAGFFESDIAKEFFAYN